MTAITAALETERMEGQLIEIPVLASEKIFKGTPVFVDASSGYAQTNDGTTITLAAGDIYMGICDETVDNSSGSSGDLKVKVWTTGVFKMPISGTVTQAKVGDPVYVNNVSDNSTLTLTSDSGNPEVQVGVLVEMIDASNGRVLIDKHILGIVANAA